MQKSEYITIKEVAECLRISCPLAYKLAETGDLPGYKIGRLWRFRIREVMDWIETKRG